MLSQLFHSPLFTFTERLFSSSLLSAIRVVSSAYLRLVVQAGFRKGRGTRDQIAIIHWITEKARVSEKHLLLLYWLCGSLWLCGSQQTVENLKEMGIPYHLTCLLRNSYAGQEAIVRAGRITIDGFKFRKDNFQAVHFHPAHLTCAEYTMWNAKLGSRLPGEISITSDIQMTAPLWQKVKRN